MSDDLSPPRDGAETKATLLARIEALDDPAMLAKLHTLLDAGEERATCRQLVEDHLDVFDPHHEPDDHQLQTQLVSPATTPLARFEAWAHPLMFGLTLGYFFLFSLLLAWTSLPEEFPPAWLWLVTGSAWLVVWSGFIAEYLWLAWAHGAARTRWFYALFPFARLVAPRLSDPRQRWLPVWGWCIGNTALVEALQKRLDWPLIGVALLILPVLLGEFLLVTPEQHPAWLWIFDLVEHAIIWLAFALEFTLLLALSRDKLAYAIQRWMDIVIILLPLVSFLRVLRLARLLKMGQLARAYRLRVLTRRSVLLAMALWRLIAPHLPRNYLRELHKLRQQLAANHRAHELLEQKITALLAEHRQAVKPSD